MPKRFIKRYIPSNETLKNNKSLGVFGKLIHQPNLWHLNRRSVSGAFMVGLFCAFIPLPSQMIIAAAFALLFRVNLPVSVALVWITNPITMPPIFYFAYMVGAWVLNTPASEIEFELSWDWLMSELSVIWEPFLLGCFICGVVAALLGYILIRIFWRVAVLKSWNQRLQKRRQSLR